MDMSKIKKATKMAKLKLSKHSPEILMVVGIGGMITTTVLAVKETPKAMRLLEERKQAENVEELTPVEVVKTAWKCYIPATITGTFSILCLIGSNSVSAKRYGALATAYKLSETAMREYKSKVIDTIGEKKEQAIRESIVKDHVKEASNTEIYITSKGNTLCLDYYSGRLFRSDLDKIRSIVNDLNFQMLNDMYVSLNDFYDRVGLANTKHSDELGWSLDTGKIKLNTWAELTEDGEPCLVIDFENAPTYNYYKLA